MAIPALDEEGFLPPGIYDCTLDEIRERFGRFNGTEQRPNLYRKLEAFVNVTRSSNLGARLIVNGSFTSNKPDPGDIDLVVELPANHDLGADLSPDAYNSISRKRVAKRYGFDILVAAEGTANHASYLDLYQSLKNREDRKKGVLRLQP
jgi:hypothetical protein